MNKIYVCKYIKDEISNKFIYSDSMTQTFDNWTAYDEWLVVNYVYYDVTSVNEVDGKVEVVYQDKPGAPAKEEKKE